MSTATDESTADVSQPDYDEYPGWLKLIVDDLVQAVERGREFTGCQYYDEHTGNVCVVGYLAQRAGYDPSVLPPDAFGVGLDLVYAKGYREYIGTDTRHRSVHELVSAVVNYYDGEVPRAVRWFLLRIQMSNDSFVSSVDGKHLTRTEYVLKEIRETHWPELRRKFGV